MDDFKKANIKRATAEDWNVPQYCKRSKGETQRLHKLSRTRLKKQDRKHIINIVEELNKDGIFQE